MAIEWEPLVTNSVKAGIVGWFLCSKEIPTWRFSHVTFSVVFLNSLSGIYRSLRPLDETADLVHNNSFILRNIFGIPCYACDIYFFYDYSKWLGVAHIFSALSITVMAENADMATTAIYEESIVISNVMSICVLSQFNKNSYGLLAGLVYIYTRYAGIRIIIQPIFINFMRTLYFETGDVYSIWEALICTLMFKSLIKET